LSVRKKLDELILKTSSYNEKKIPEDLLKNIKEWQWGSYGWVSPASLIFTAAWRKAFYPDQDCCKIWARDEQGNPIPGGYSIRSEDEDITIPLLSKHELCQGFCSENSGMQGSRAIEKMRSLKRLDTDFSISQRTVFNLKLFSIILNQINSLSDKQALEVVRFLIVIAKEIHVRRTAMLTVLRSNIQSDMDIMAFLAETADPELTKCITAACLDVLFSPSKCFVAGVEDHKTASDTRSQKSGDLCVMLNDEPRICIEVKDKTQSIDWNNIERARKTLERDSSLRSFIFVMEKRKALTKPIVAEIFSSSKMYTQPYDKIAIESLQDLYLFASSIVDIEVLVNKTSEFIAITPGIKPETKKDWIDLYTS